MDDRAAYFTFSSIEWLFYRHTNKQRHYTDATKHNLANLFYDDIYSTVKCQAMRIRRQESSGHNQENG
ncbi:MAG: hypothetical protein LUB61_02180 [Eggerthellaceae bacterium]|nr:hypothetical protein [Eggerthellaceae bacterium]